MINLLPTEMKKDLRAARTNTTLLRYNIILLIAVLFLTGAIAVVYIFLSTMKATAEQSIQDNVVKEQSYASVKQEAESFKNSLSDAKSILSNEISYSRALIRYAQLFPEGTAINDIQLTEASFTGPMNVSVKITGQAAAQSLIQSMTSSQYVTNFSRTSITTTKDGTYPYTMEVTFRLKKEIAS
jgi:hypothetical protein